MPLLLTAFESTVPNLANGAFLLLCDAEEAALHYLNEVDAAVPSLQSHQDAISFCSQFQYAVILSRLGDTRQAHTVIDQLEKTLFFQLQHTDNQMSEKECAVMESYFTLLNDQTTDAFVHERLQDVIFSIVSPISMVGYSVPLSSWIDTSPIDQWYMQTVSWRNWSKKVKNFCSDLVEVVTAIGYAATAVYGVYSACDYMVHSHHAKIVELEERIKRLGVA